MDDDTGFKAAITVGTSSSPVVHSHAARAAIWWGGKVGIVGTRAILSIDNGEIVAFTTLVAVVDLEVTSSLVEAKGVEKVMVSVGSVEELSNGEVLVGGWGSSSWAPWVAEDEVGALWAVVVDIGATASWVVLGNGVVTTGGWVLGHAIRVPGVGRGISPWVTDGGWVSLSGIVETPGTISPLDLFLPKHIYIIYISEWKISTYKTLYSAEAT